ncbi:EF-hand domain-containing protein [Sulfurimonas sp. HSL-1716]|uniref:EF-hand domain-containing protein n=1 Tax=Hydrocurvibacter sulfurireducens TaxID=3131937 RepID=UPI0031F89579
MTVSSSYNAYSSYSSSGVTSSAHRGKPDFEKMAQELLTSMDSDNSSSIDKTEFSAAAQALASNSNSSTSSTSSDTSSASDVFDTLDTNSDGTLSTDELMAALKNMKPPKPPQGQDGDMPPPPPGGMPPPNDSSSASSDTSGIDKLFSALDTNQDGSISSDELSALFGDSTDQDSSTTASASSTDNITKQISNDWLQKILSYYGNNSASSTDTTSLLNTSA